MRDTPWPLMLILCLLLGTVTSAGARDSVLFRGKPIRFPTPEHLAIPPISEGDHARTPLAAPSWVGPLPFKTNANPPDTHDLRQWQTAVKDQNPRGSCQSFAFLGALEALYRRNHSMTLDLSEEYFIHGVFTRQHTHNPSVGRDNFTSFCGTLDVAEDTSGVDGRIQMVKTGMMLPEEKYAPYFGNGNWGYVAYGTDHRHNDMAVIAQSHGYQTVTADGYDWCNDAYYRDNPWDFTQQMIDNFEYDNRYIPLEARKNVKYGATKIVFLSSPKTRDTALLESILSADQEIDAGFGLGKLDCGDPNYDDGTPVQTLDGATICRYPVVPSTWCLQPGCKGLWEWIDANGDYGEAGHELLIVGYDRTRQLFLLKNSWGGTLSYLWVPYQFMEEKSGGGAIVLEVRDPNLDPVPQEIMVGKWDMDHDGHLGEVVIRRPRKPVEDVQWNSDYTVFEYETPHFDRIGSYRPLGDDQPSYEVRGTMVDDPAHLLHFYIDFSQTEPAPYVKDYQVPAEGQEFKVLPFSGGLSYSNGNFAAGWTDWSGTRYGTLLARPDVDLKYTAGSFSINNWKDSFKLYFSNGERAVLKITSVGSLQGGSYPVSYKLGNKSGNTSIASGTPHQLPLPEKDVILNYHTWETGLASGLGPALGAFGLRTADIGVTDVTATDGAYTDKVRVTWSPHPDAKNYVGAYAVGRSLSADGDATMIGSTGGTQYNDTTADPGKIYYYWVSVVGKDGEWTPYSSHDTGFRKVLPPAKVSATDGTRTDGVRVTWDPSQGAVLSYSVYRALSQKGPGAIGILLGTTSNTSFDDTTATPYYNYYYFVLTNSPSGSSAASKSDKGFRAIAAPTDLTATDGTYEGLVMLNWTGSVNAGFYKVLRATSAVQRTKAIGTATNTTFDDTTAAPGATYYYRVQACNNYGCSESSNTDSGYALLAGPANVKATKGEFSDKVRITWSAKTGATSYEVYVGTALIGGKSLLGKTNSTGYDHKKPKPGIMYYYWVKSKNKYATSGYSSSYDVGYTKIAGPTGVAANLGDGYVRITWNHVADATGYLVSRSTSGHGGQQALGTSTTTRYDDTTAPFGSGATIYYWVQAVFGASPPYMASDYGGPAQIVLPAY